MRKVWILTLSVLFMLALANISHAIIPPIGGFIRGVSNTRSSPQSSPKKTPKITSKNKCDALLFKYTCTRDLRGVGEACKGKYVACECIYKHQEVFCTYNQTCSKYVCGNVCIQCEGDPYPKAETCPVGYSKDVVGCKWPLSLLNLGSCGKCDANCPKGYSLETKYCKKGYKIQVTPAGCGKCVKEQ